MLGDHNLVLFPQSAIKFFLGYWNVNQTGPALSTANLFGLAAMNSRSSPIFSAGRMNTVSGLK